ncbi:MAG: sulfatase-like hydrolase/transferase [Pirellulaceae bacterium]
MERSILARETSPPNIVLVMTDDQGWGQTGYYDHPVLETPNLDAMAAGGLRFDRFYAGAPVCSPTRASVLTGRSNMRTGVNSHGYALRRQERTLAGALKKVGYATGHFGKWHLNGMRGPGVPILADDTHNPGAFGFDEWLSVTNFFDRDPIMSRNGEFVEFKGDSSEIIVGEALKFIGDQAASATPFLAVIWYGTPHSPFRAADKDMEPFDNLDERSRKHYGELVAMDRSVGALREGLRKLNIADDTLVWFCSDNGGLPRISPETVGGLRGFKGSLYEGGLRVPGIVEWPAHIKEPRATHFPAVTMDIFPTIADIVDLPDSATLEPQDGISLLKLFTEKMARRDKPIPFCCFNDTAWLDNEYKLIRLARKRDTPEYELYNLASDPKEQNDLYREEPELAERLRTEMEAWVKSMNASIAGKDYPAGKVLPGDPEPRFWMEVDAYRPYFSDWEKRPEYKSRLQRRK